MNPFEKLKTKILQFKSKHPFLLEVIFGLLASALVTGLCFLMYYTKVPTPGIVLVAFIILITSTLGSVSGGLVLLGTIIYSLIYYSIGKGNNWFTYTDTDLYSLILIIVFSSICYAIMFIIRHRHIVFTNKILKLNKFLELDNQQLQEISMSDSLTRTKNRFALRKDFDKFNNEFIHVLMFDIDNFKWINDTLGHTAGDYVLKRIGAVTKKVFGVDSCYRYGGDEFLIITIDMSEEEFQSKVQDLKQAIAEITVSKKNISTRFSGGYVYGIPESTMELRSMIKEADVLLYKVKTSGKDDTQSHEFKHK